MFRQGLEIKVNHGENSVVGTDENNQMQALNKCITFSWKLSCGCTTY